MSILIDSTTKVKRIIFSIREFIQDENRLLSNILYGLEGNRGSEILNVNVIWRIERVNNDENSCINSNNRIVYLLYKTLSLHTTDIELTSSTWQSLVVLKWIQVLFQGKIYSVANIRKEGATDAKTICSEYYEHVFCPFLPAEI
jgi:hypothetical protein